MTIGQGIDTMLRRLERLQAPPDIRFHKARWRGRIFACSTSSERRGETVELGGEVAEVVLTIIIRQSELGSFVGADSANVTADNTVLTADGGAVVPVPNDNIQLVSTGRNYRIVTVHQDAAHSHWSIHCSDPDRP